VRTTCMSWRRAGLAAVTLLLLTGLAGSIASALAASPSASAPPANGKVTLRVGWLGEPDNLNPFIGGATGLESYTVWDNNYDPLVGLNPTDLKPSKDVGLADDWASTPDGKRWTFTIRPNVKWQDGQPLTARDVAFTIDLIVDNQDPSWISYLQTVKKATAVDDTHVEILCKQPAPGMLVNLAAVPILPEHIWSKMSYQAAARSFVNKPPIIGSGPFQCTQWKKSNFLVMEANKSYWRGAPHIDQIVFEDYTNADTMGQNMKAGAIDACGGLLQAQMQTLPHTPGITARAVRANEYDELGFNCYTGGPSLGNPVLRDWKFRQALQWAIDKNKLCQIAYGGMAKPADTVITADYSRNPDWHWTPPADQAYTFNLAKAGQMLTAAGYPLKNGVRLDKTGKPITLRLFARNEYAPSIPCGKFITGWFRQLGLNVVLSAMDDGALTAAQYNTVKGKFTPNYDMFIWGWYLDIDPGIEMAYLCTDQINGWSDSAWSYPPYDSLYKQQAVEMDQPTRLQDIYRLQQMIYEQSPYIPLAYADDTEAWNTSRWTGWIATPAPNGNVVFPEYGYGSYFTVKPVTGAKTSQAGRTGVLVAIIAGAVVVLAVAVFVVVRKRRPPEATEV
jgi:peptide/nickel transport system substrate-binding protein